MSQQDGIWRVLSVAVSTDKRAIFLQFSDKPGVLYMLVKLVRKRGNQGHFDARVSLDNVVHSVIITLNPKQADELLIFQQELLDIYRKQIEAFAKSEPTPDTVKA